MNDDFSGIREIIQSAPSLKKVNDLMMAEEIIHLFSELFPALKGNVEAVKFEKGALIVRVENPALRSELKLHDAEIIKKINTAISGERLKKIKFTA